MRQTVYSVPVALPAPTMRPTAGSARMGQTSADGTVQTFVDGLPAEDLEDLYRTNAVDLAMARLEVVKREKAASDARTKLREQMDIQKALLRRLGITEDGFGVSNIRGA